MKIILIGPPCSGKSYISTKLSSIFNISCYDTDNIFSEYYNIEPYKYIQEYNDFRNKEYEIFDDFINNNNDNFILATGGGIVTYSKSQNLLINLKNKSDYYIIFLNIRLEVFLKRIVCSNTHLKKEDYESTFKERYNLYEEICSHKFNFFDLIIDNEMKYFTKFIKNITEKHNIIPNSYFLCLNFKEFQNDYNDNFDKKCKDYLKNITSNSDALEIRLDYYNLQKKEIIEYNISNIQNILDIPLIITIRSKKEWGNFDSNNKKQLLLQNKIIDLCLKLGIRYLDYELHYESVIENRYNSNVIGSIHSKDINYIIKNLEKVKLHNPDIIKLVVSNDLYLLVKELVKKYETKNILIACNNEGQYSRIKNLYFTPITHKKINSVIEGQMTFENIENIKKSLELNKGEFYLFETNIKSLDHVFIHNYVFEFFNKNWVYNLYKTQFIDNIIKLLKRPYFCGASLNNEFNENIIKYLDKITKNCKIIGSVDTIKKYNGLIEGFNTNWLAVYNIIKNIVKDNNILYAFILGNNGISRSIIFALNKVNIKCIIFSDNIKKTKKDCNNLDVYEFNKISIIDKYLHKSQLFINCIYDNHNLKLDKLPVNSYYIDILNSKLDFKNKINIITYNEILSIKAFYQYCIWNNIVIDTENINKILFNKYSNAIKLYDYKNILL